jgi:hypothetical protein
MNNLYTEADNQALISKVDEIINAADKLTAKVVKPSVDDLWGIVFTVRDFVKEKKRKIYGGFALNKLIESVDPRDKFYSDDDIKSWDIDFYSPSPIDDAKEIADRLKAKGFKHIQAREALHDETYKVFAETNDCADITYVPKNIYHKIPFKEVDGLYLTGPHFMMIDYFRVLTDPLTSYFRLEKTFTRLYLMAKHYPLPKNTSSIDIVPPERDLDVAMHTVHNFLINRETTITVGMYAYNHLIRESKINERGKNIKRSGKPGNIRNNKNNDSKTNINYVDINYYEIVSTHYKTDARELIMTLKDKFSVSSGRITYRENYPFFQYLGYGIDIFFDDDIICRMYHYNSRCTPFFDVPALYFKHNTYDEEKGKIRIGSFATLMLYNLINVMRARTNDDHNSKNLHYILISHMIEMKNYFKERTGKTIMDESLFGEFVLRCAGETTTPQMERAERIEKKIKAGKRFSWSYNPANERDKNNTSKYVFKNSSGNPINNDKNKKIDLEKGSTTEEIDNINDEEDNESEPASESTSAPKTTL